MTLALKGKVAIITGSGKGIGKEIATLFAQEGAKVALVDLNFNNVYLLAEELRTRGYEALPIVMDVTNENQVIKGIKQIVEHFGKVHILVSNAGIQHIELIEQLSLKKWKQVLAV